ncbi:hypothetical protein COT40_01475 [Candidatus Peregrinibacteria bacterium CG08_land_8_20_14_0_20_41_10]|nr:MAG: hypothetical protein AUJ78_01930 [Candidatus Peregrinibacteria bacterium CG1_02_41_10]PIS32165.1 MAG: hypothetical protein COT40_01475 [Candidatus Peregrinibacteria bacterium CG08_land_8_20_14_0_20_41_10]
MFGKSKFLERHKIIFPGQHPGEEFCFFFRKHAVVLLWPLGKIILESLMLILILLIIVSESQFFRHTDIGLTLGLLFVAAMTFYMYKFLFTIYGYVLRVFFVTNYRLIDIKQTLIFIDERSAIDLREIQDIKAFTNGLWANSFKFGTLRINLSGVGQTKFINHIPYPEKLVNLITELKEKKLSHQTDSLKPEQ